MHFSEIIMVKEIKQVLIMRPHIFSFSWLCFKMGETKCIRIPLSFPKQQQEISLITTLPFSSRCSWCEDWEGSVMFADTEMWCWNVPRYADVDTSPQWRPAPDITCCCCWGRGEMLMEFEMMLKSRAGGCSESARPHESRTRHSLYCYILWKCNV